MGKSVTNFQRTLPPSHSELAQAITKEQLRRHRFPKPPLDEQIAISEFLDSETAKLDTLTAEAQRAIDLLQERRIVLISAAVTGQVDVRGPAPA